MKLCTTVQSSSDEEFSAINTLSGQCAKLAGGTEQHPQYFEGVNSFYKLQTGTSIVNNYGGALILSTKPFAYNDNVQHFQELFSIRDKDDKELYLQFIENKANNHTSFNCRMLNNVGNTTSFTLADSEYGGPALTGANNTFTGINTFDTSILQKIHGTQLTDIDYAPPSEQKTLELYRVINPTVNRMIFLAWLQYETNGVVSLWVKHINKVNTAYVETKIADLRT